MAAGQPKWNDSVPMAWDKEVERFFASLKVFDNYLASNQTLHAAIEKLFQGPVADALTHVGQIAMLRRLAGSRVLDRLSLCCVWIELFELPNLWHCAPLLVTGSSPPQVSLRRGVGSQCPIEFTS